MVNYDGRKIIMVLKNKIESKIKLGNTKPLKLMVKRVLLMKIKDMKPTFTPEKGIEVLGNLVCRELSYALTKAGVFFTVEPMPDNVCAFYVKEEAIHILEESLEVAKQATRERCKTCDALYAGNEPRNCQILKSTNSCRFVEEM